jgi:hypothetical protein
MSSFGSHDAMSGSIEEGNTKAYLFLYKMCFGKHFDIFHIWCI